MAGALGPGGQLADLVFDGLAAGADTDVKRNAGHVGCLLIGLPTSKDYQGRYKNQLFSVP